MAKREVPDVWYKDGLQFTCTQCGDCCTGEEGFVWVNAEEVRQLSARLRLSEDEFRSLYVRQVGDRESLREREDGACVFWEAGRGCTVYSDRPRQCRSWPFWNSNIRSAREWRRTMRICPGSGTGRIHTAEEILAQSRLIDL